MPYFLVQRLREPVDELPHFGDRLVSDSCLHLEDHTWLAVSLQQKMASLQVEQTGCTVATFVAFTNTAFTTCTESIGSILGEVMQPPLQHPKLLASMKMTH